MKAKVWREVMRIAPVLALIAGFAVLSATAYEAAAHSRRDDRPRVFIKKRSYLDAGTEVQPLSKNYHDHIYTREARYPTIGPNSQGDARWPLPGQFDLPNFR
jgi:hypothetical protein